MSTKLMRRIKRLQKLTGTGTFNSRLTRDVLRVVIDTRSRPAEEVAEIFGTITTEVTTDPATGYTITNALILCPSVDGE